jgi:hypothetical protein
VSMSTTKVSRGVDELRGAVLTGLDSGSIQAGGGEAWLISKSMFSHLRVYWKPPEISCNVRPEDSADSILAFQTELRRQLPKPYIISHGESTLS